MDINRPIVNALTIDVEDYYHVTAFEGEISRHQWDRFPSRVVPNTQRLLDLLDRHQIRATFFVLGWIAHRFPALIRAIADAGHEIGCHGYWHRLIYHMTPEEFRHDLRQARDVLEEIVGDRVVAHRAPSWSITKRSLWALDILAEEGFRYDSSIFPIYHDRYGIPKANPFPHRVNGVAERLWEFPASVVRYWKMNVPVSGGGYFRVYPVSWTAHWLGLINQRYEQPFLFYIHPWELDPGQPRLAAGGWGRWRHYYNLAATGRKFDWLLGQFRFGCLSQVLETYFSSEAAVTPHAASCPQASSSIPHCA
jgi:polysaccharide deacetylase family protein (PEP-CTERM system associated)